MYAFRDKLFSCGARISNVLSLHLGEVCILETNSLVAELEFLNVLYLNLEDVCILETNFLVA